jgi:hypothetical protein
MARLAAPVLGERRRRWRTVSGTYEVTVIADSAACFVATITPAPWTARDAQELATDLARCLKPGHTVKAVGSQDEGQAES